MASTVELLDDDERLYRQLPDSENTQNKIAGIYHEISEFWTHASKIETLMSDYWKTQNKDRMVLHERVVSANRDIDDLNIEGSKISREVNDLNEGILQVAEHNRYAAESRFWIWTIATYS
jgi:hypothetical protein